MKICLYGAGSIGGIIGAHLARVKGIEVSLIARGAHLAAIRKNGLRLVSPTEDFTVRVAATGIVAAVETLMQADTTQFGGNILYPAPGVTGLALLQNNTQQGAVARVAFDLAFKARIGG